MPYEISGNLRIYKKPGNFSTNYVFAGGAGASQSYTGRLQTTIQVFQISGKSRGFFWGGSTPPDLDENPEPERFPLKNVSALRAAWTKTHTVHVNFFSALRAAWSTDGKKFLALRADN